MFLQLATTAWGVGHVMGADLDQAEAEADLAAILALWSGSIDRSTFDSIVSQLQAVSQGYVAPFGARLVSEWLSRTTESALDGRLGEPGTRLVAQEVGAASRAAIGRLLVKITPNVIATAFPSAAHLLPLVGHWATAVTSRQTVRAIGAHAKIYYTAKLLSTRE